MKVIINKGAKKMFSLRYRRGGAKSVLLQGQWTLVSGVQGVAQGLAVAAGPVAFCVHDEALEQQLFPSPVPHPHEGAKNVR